MSERLYFDQLEIGQRWHSPSRVISQADVTAFAELTGDFDPLHTDPEFAKKSPFGRPIAHGLLGLSLAAGLSSTCPPVRTAAFVALRDWQFLKPIYFGDEVYSVIEVITKSPSGRRRGRVIWQRQLVNQSGEVVQEGIFETLVDRQVSAVPKPHTRGSNVVAKSESPSLPDDAG